MNQPTSAAIFDHCQHRGVITVWRRAIASYRVRHNKRCKVLVSQMSATVYYRLSADASRDYRRNGRSQSSPPAFSSNEIPFPVSASCYSAKLNLDAIALRSGGTGLTTRTPVRKAGSTGVRTASVAASRPTQLPNVSPRLSPTLTIMNRTRRSMVEMDLRPVIGRVGIDSWRPCSLLGW